MDLQTMNTEATAIDKLHMIQEMLEELVDLGEDYSQFMWAQTAHKELKKAQRIIEKIK
jgi:hypothetical protein